MTVPDRVTMALGSRGTMTLTGVLALTGDGLFSTLPGLFLATKAGRAAHAAFLFLIFWSSTLRNASLFLAMVGSEGPTTFAVMVKEN